MRLRRETAAWASILAILAAVVAYEVAIPGASDPPEGEVNGETSVEAVAVDPIAVEDPPPVEAYAAILQRPLFERNRRPAVVEAANTAEAEPARVVRYRQQPKPRKTRQAPPRPTLVLKGIALEGGNGLALLSSGDGTDYVAIGTGESVEGWTVKEILPDRVRLGVDEHVLDLDLHLPRSNE